MGLVMGRPGGSVWGPGGISDLFRARTGNRGSAGTRLGSIPRSEEWRTAEGKRLLSPTASSPGVYSHSTLTTL